MTPKTGSSKDLKIMGLAEGAQMLLKDIESIRKKRVCIALSGGRSAAAFYPLLKKKLGSLRGRQLHFFLLDERICRRQRNSGPIKKALGIKNLQVLGAGKSQALLNDYNKKFRAGCRGFDIIIAGVGEDCHIASLFPGSALLKNKQKQYLLVKDSPKPPRTRITASPKMIKAARFRYLLFVGKAKKNAYAAFIDAKKGIQDCPAKLAAGTNLRIIAKFD
jgi:6-phosphogluconolactonase/glucosamine-6-phosphate isomerase/deaminase